MYKYMLFPGFKDKAVTLSYDDGVVFDKKLIEIMQAHGLKGTFNINSGMYALAPTTNGRLTKEEALKLYTESGMEVAVHGEYHLSLAEVDAASATRDILQDRLNLESLFGGIIKGMAYANGSVDDRAVEILRNCGIHYARTIESTHNFYISSDWLRMPATCHHNDPKLNELIDAFFAPMTEHWHRYPRLFYLWGHSYEFAWHNNWEVIENFAKRVGNRDDVWYATNGEIYAYAKAYERLEYSVSGKRVYNPSNIDVYMHTLQFEKVCVPAGQTIELL